MKMYVWAASLIGGLWLGYVWFGDFFRAWFVLSSNDNIFMWFVAFASVLFIPMVLGSAVLPVIGGTLIVGVQLLSILFILPASQFEWEGSGLLVVEFYLPALLVGLGFWWSGRQSLFEKATAPGGMSP